MKLMGVRNAIECLVKHDPKMPLGMIRIFFAIAQHGGEMKMPRLYAVFPEIPQASISRHVSALGKYGRKGNKGLSLVELEEDTDNRSHKIIRLTAKGRDVAEKMSACL